MALRLDLPDKDDPIWTAANAFVVRKDEGAMRYIGHEAFSVKVTGEQTGGALALMESVVQPGHGNIPHVHRTEDEAFYVVSGTFQFINGDQKLTAGPGDFVYVPKGTRHGFKAISAEPARMLVFFTPAGNEAFFLKYGDTEQSAEPWSDEKHNSLLEALTAHNSVLLPTGDDWD